MHLVIVESPSKAKTIESYLGSSYRVASCNGHIRDLPKGRDAVDIENNFTPTYVISPGKNKIVSTLKALAKDAESIYLASDDDREGESISWHLSEALALSKRQVKRIVFREITKKAVLRALAAPRAIDLHLVHSQQARRILDRLVGYDLSAVLWKKVRPGLSAGRVQSVAVRLVVEREREIRAFTSQSSFVATACFMPSDNASFKATLSETFDQEQQAQTFLEQCRNALFTVEEIEKKPAYRAPSPPFTTSTLQQEASRRLGYSVARTMTVAQQLYEAGHISYMRTDSVYLAQEACQAARHVIQETYGADYHQYREHATRSATAQEAHEAIRPTDFARREVGGDQSAQTLYNLIWQRAIASQMAEARLEKTVMTIHISSHVTHKFIARGQVVQFPGFLSVYGSSGNPTETDLLPAVSVGETLLCTNIIARERFSSPPARYTEAGLVKQLEERGVGRPSTYAPTISTIQNRGYVLKRDQEGTLRSYVQLALSGEKIRRESCQETVGKEKQKLAPTDMAMIVNDFLVSCFSEVTDYDFTAKVEEELDAIAQGKQTWSDMLADFYATFLPKVSKVSELDRKTVGTIRPLGRDPESGKAVIARVGRYGPMIQLGDAQEQEKSDLKFASILPGQHIDTITLSEALELLKLPMALGQFETEPVYVKVGKYGPYLDHAGKFYGLSKDQNPFDMTLQSAQKHILTAREAEAQRTVKTFESCPELEIRKGRWGLYIRFEKKNIKIPRQIEQPGSLTLEACREIIASATSNPKPYKRNGTKQKKQ